MTIGNTVALGPLVISTDRLLALLAIAAFIGLVSFLTRKSSRPMSNAATAAVVAGLVMGRIGYVALHIPSFSDDPLSALAIWQGGFSVIAGIVGAALVLVVTLRRAAVLYRSLASLGIAVMVWAAAAHHLLAETAIPLPKGLVAYTIDGQPVAIDSFRGKPFVINLWATWCGPCQREMPMLMRAAAARPAVPVLFIDQGETPDVVAAFVAAKRLTSPNILIDRSHDFSRAAGSGALPTTLFVAGDGMIRESHAGVISRAAFDDGIDDILETNERRT